MKTNENKKNEKNIEEKAKGIYKLAKDKGLDDNPFFLTTYHSLMVQIKMLKGLEESYNKDGTTITKEYVKGRENIYIHPSIDKYSKVSDSALNKIIKLKDLIDKQEDQSETSLEKFINEFDL